MTTKLETFCYKIRNNETGLFCVGGVQYNIEHADYWNSKGKIYLHKNVLTRHLNFYKEHAFKNNALPDNWEIVKYEFTEVEIIPSFVY